MYQCAANGCKNNGTNECFSCKQHFCDTHMLQTRLEGTHIGTIVIEACQSCTLYQAGRVYDELPEKIHGRVLV
jgi:hypothetical protein